MLPKWQEIPSGTSGISLLQGCAEGLFNASLTAAILSWKALCPSADTERQSRRAWTRNHPTWHTLPPLQPPIFHHFAVYTFSSCPSTRLLGLDSALPWEIWGMVQGLLCAASGTQSPARPSAAPRGCSSPGGAQGRDFFPFTSCSLVWHMVSLWKMTAAFCTFSLSSAPSMPVSIFQRYWVVLLCCTKQKAWEVGSPAAPGLAAWGLSPRCSQEPWPKPQSSEAPIMLFFLSLLRHWDQTVALSYRSKYNLGSQVLRLSICFAATSDSGRSSSPLHVSALWCSQPQTQLK